jgi:DNA polymerase delta subunit 1
MIGYNILNFDFPYLVNRAQALKLPAFLQWGRIRNSALRMKDAQFSSKAYGTHAYKDITIEGRVQFDLLTAIQRDHKLSSYSLNAVSAHFLGAVMFLLRSLCLCRATSADASIHVPSFINGVV